MDAGAVAAGVAMGVAGVGETGAASAGATGVEVGVGSCAGVFSCSGGVGWVGDDRERNGTGAFQGGVRTAIVNPTE